MSILKVAQAQVTKNQSTQEKQSASSTLKQEDATVFNELENWQKQHDDNMKNASRRLNDQNEVNKYGEDSIYEDYYKKEDDIGLEFNFMEGKDAKKEDEYEEQIHKLAQGEFDKKDANGDNKVTKEEYINDEISSLDKDDSEELKILTKAYSYLMASLMDQGMGNSNNDGVLDVEEFESFYKNLDRFNGEGLDKEGDGTISTAAFDMPAWLIENIFDEDTINKVISLALENKI